MKIELEAIEDGTNDELVRALAKFKGVVNWPCVPRVGDSVVVRGDSYTVKHVFWDFPEGSVLVRIR